MRRAKSLWERWENKAIYHVKSLRKKRVTIPSASQVVTFDYVGSLVQSKWNRMRLTR